MQTSKPGQSALADRDASMKLAKIRLDEEDEDVDLADTSTLWYFIRVVSKTRGDRELEQLLETLNTSLTYELRYHEKSRMALEILLGSANSHMSCKFTSAPTTGQVSDAPGQVNADLDGADDMADRSSSKRLGVPSMLECEELLASCKRKIEAAIRKSWEAGNVAVHPLLVMFEVKMCIRTHELNEARQQQPQQLQGPASKRPAKEAGRSLSRSVLTRNHVLHSDYSMLGLPMPHTCLLRWKSSEKFDPEWPKQSRFLSRDYQMPPNARLLLWMLWDYKDCVAMTVGRSLSGERLMRVAKSLEEKNRVYDGETLLHMAIMRTDFELVAYLVELGACVRARATGSLFAEHHFGEFPLNFAARAGSTRIVDFLLKDYESDCKRIKYFDATGKLSAATSTKRKLQVNPNSDKDAQGNSVLHICVLNGNMEMYLHLVTKYNLSELVLNNKDLTPLTLAASLGKQECFDAIVTRRREELWSLGNVARYSESMTEHETDLVNLVAPSTLEVIIKENQTRMMSDPFISKLVLTKWLRIRPSFFFLFGLYTLNCAAFIQVVLSDSKHDAFDGYDLLTIGLSAMFLGSSLWFSSSIVDDSFSAFWVAMVDEVNSQDTIWSTQFFMMLKTQLWILVQDITLHVGRSGLFLLWLGSTLSIYLTVCSHDSSLEMCHRLTAGSVAILETISLVSSGLFLMWFFLTGVLVMNIGLYVLIVWQCFRIIAPFAVVYVFLVFPPAVVLNSIHESSEEDVEQERGVNPYTTVKVHEFETFTSSLAKLFSVGISGMEFEDFEFGRSEKYSIVPGLPSTVILGYTVMVNIVLLNLLIAVLSAKIEDILEMSTLQMRMQQARLIFWIERLPLFWLPSRSTHVGQTNRATEDPFINKLERAVNLGLQHGEVEYQSFVVWVTLPNVGWQPLDAFHVKRVVLDACMQRPSLSGGPTHLFDFKTFQFIPCQSGGGGGADKPRASLSTEPLLLAEVFAEPCSHGGEKKEQLYHVTHDLDIKNHMKNQVQSLIEKSTPEPKKENNVLEDISPTGLPNDVEVFDNIQQGMRSMSPEFKTQEETDSEEKRRLDFDLQQMAGFTLWRSGCLVRGGGGLDVHFVTGDSDSTANMKKKSHWWSNNQSQHNWERNRVSVELQLYVPIVRRGLMSRLRGMLGCLVGVGGRGGVSPEVQHRMSQVQAVAELQRITERLVSDDFDDCLAKVLPNLSQAPRQVNVEVIQQSNRSIIEEHLSDSVNFQASKAKYPVVPPKELSEMSAEDLQSWQEECTRALWKLWNEQVLENTEPEINGIDKLQRSSRQVLMSSTLSRGSYLNKSFDDIALDRLMEENDEFSSQETFSTTTSPKEKQRRVSQ